MSSDEICTLKRYFELKSSHTSDYWLQCCLKWYKENHNPHTKDDMCNIIYQQWLCSDLQDIEVGCLPKNLKHQKVITLKGTYVLQVMYIKDISKSSYSQLKYMRDMYKFTQSYEDTEKSGKRMLYLQMTDGIQYIHGYEYQTVCCLNLCLTPGIKLLLTGPLTVRNGEILLKENNVTVLGGEVEDLKIKNAAENVLARELNMPENPNPASIETESNKQQTTQQLTCTQMEETNIKNSENFDLILKDDQLLLNLDPSIFEDNEIASSTKINSDLDRDEDLFKNFNINEAENYQIADNTRFDISNKFEEYMSHIDTITKVAASTQIHSDLDKDEDLFKNFNINEVENELIAGNTDNTSFNISNEFEQYLSHIDTITEEASPRQINSYLNKDEDLFKNFNIPEAENKQVAGNRDNTSFYISNKLEQDYMSHVDTITKIGSKSSQLINRNQEPFIYIKYLLDNMNILKQDKSYRVKAWFVKNVEKLKVNKKTKVWTMKFEIKDASGNIIVNFLSGVIENLIGLSPAEGLALRRSVKNKETESHEKLYKALQRCQEKLQNGEYLLDLRVNNKKNTLFTVINLQQVTMEILKQIKSRVESVHIELL